MNRCKPFDRLDFENQLARKKEVYDQVIVVDDFSTDGTRDLLQKRLEERGDIILELRARNGGKGAAVQAGLKRATGDVVIIQDADLEYDPADYPLLLRPIQTGRSRVVYGSRFIGEHRAMYFWHSLGNQFLTLVCNVLFDTTLTDMETCYKVFRREIIQSIRIEEDRFGFEPEITVKVAKRRLRIYEVGISYWGRTYEEGKKIGWKDGVRALWCLLKYSIKEPVVAPQAISEVEPPAGREVA